MTLSQSHASAAQDQLRKAVSVLIYAFDPLKPEPPYYFLAHRAPTKGYVESDMVGPSAHGGLGDPVGRDDSGRPLFEKDRELLKREILEEIFGATKLPEDDIQNGDIVLNSPEGLSLYNELMAHFTKLGQIHAQNYDPVIKSWYSTSDRVYALPISKDLMDRLERFANQRTLALTPGSDIRLSEVAKFKTYTMDELIARSQNPVPGETAKLMSTTTEVNAIQKLHQRLVLSHGHYPELKSAHDKVIAGHPLSPEDVQNLLSIASVITHKGYRVFKAARNGGTVFSASQHPQTYKTGDLLAYAVERGDNGELFINPQSAYIAEKPDGKPVADISDIRLYYEAVAGTIDGLRIYTKKPDGDMLIPVPFDDNSADKRSVLYLKRLPSGEYVAETRPWRALLTMQITPNLRHPNSPAP